MKTIRLMGLALAALLSLCLLGTATPALAQPQPIPPNILAKQNLPMVMLTASKDYNMFWKAYTDFDDIDFDGAIDYTYKPAFSYYGYFDPTKCYTYVTTDGGRFEPTELVDASAAPNLYCRAGNKLWSGNFMNWATMARIDVLRKVLYGGLRSTDTASQTVLEMSFVPRNSQTFPKYYNGADLPKLTPFNDDATVKAGITTCRRSAENAGVSQTSVFTPEIRVAVGNMLLWNMTEVRSCNWSSEVGYNWRNETLDFVNANYTTPYGDTGSANSAHKHLSSVPAKTTGATTATGVGPGYVARILACVPTLLGTENCKRYNTTTPAYYKPIGLLQEFGESADSGRAPARAEFALLMGSYDNNLQAGVLRKNMAEINDEIEAGTGRFISPATGKGGIIRSFNEITLFNYDQGTGNYGYTCLSDTIINGTCPSWGNPVGELVLESLRYYAGKSPAVASGVNDLSVGLPAVSAWVDPLSATADATKINGLGTRSALYGQAICRSLNMLTISGGINSYDDVSGMANFTDITSTATAASLTKTIGDKEGITGTKRLFGSVQGDPANTATTDQLCTAKTVGDFGKVLGACPEGPNLRGTYLGAGAAHYANTHRIRSDLDATAAKVGLLPYNALTVRNYAVTLSGGIATIEVPVPGKVGAKVLITPASIDYIAGRPIPGNMVDFKVITRSSDGMSGTAIVLWQHAYLGEDQDQDMMASLRWKVGGTTAAPTLTIYTQTLESDTGSTQPYADGYTITGVGPDNAGVAQDGVHFHSSINNYVVPATETNIDTTGALYVGAFDSTKCGGSARLCVRIGTNYVRGETSKTYNMTGTSASLLKEPLWYIAKYGGFKYTEADWTAAAAASATLYPDRQDEWDTRSATGVLCDPTVTDVTAANKCDGTPDNYFVARRPDLLETSLRRILDDIVNSSNTAPAVAATELLAGDLKYVAKFDLGDGHGELSSYKLLSTGDFDTNATWNAHENLGTITGQARPVITNVGTTAMPFQWAQLTTAQQNILMGTTADPVYGQDLLAWVRGRESSRFRSRSAKSVMGPIVNSSPLVQGPPNGLFDSDLIGGYGDFVNTYKARKTVLWVGAGDGMLHAFDGTSDAANGGKPLLSYIPQPVFSRLPDWALIGGDKVQAFVDGSPVISDVNLGTTTPDWHTYLFEALGRGGKGMFALDVTDPTTFSETNASSIYKWQFTSTDDTSGDLGYILSEPSTSRFTGQSAQVARMNTGDFAVLYGNGVQSTNGSAALYILFAKGPGSSGWSGNYRKIVADVGPNNGLSTPVWVDLDGDGKADVIYAGDLKGNLWKFDVSSTNAASWTVAYSGRPLFKATDASNNVLPIVGAVQTRSHPFGGLIVDFATGKAITTGDFPNTVSTQAIYGIWDKPAFAALTGAALTSALPIAKSSLAARTFNNLPDGSRGVTGAAIDWTTNLGWALPFTESSEMSLSNMAIVNGLLAVVSVAPPPAKVNATDPDPCYAKPLGRLNLIDPVTGSPDPTRTIVVKINGVDTVVAVATINVGTDQKLTFTKTQVPKPPPCTPGPGVTCTPPPPPKCAIRTGIGETSKTDVGCTPLNKRIFWREIPGLKSLTH